MYLSVWMLLPLTASLWCLIQLSISWSLLNASLLYSLVSEYELVNTDTFDNRWNTKILQSNRTNASMKWNEQISRELKKSINRFNTLMGISQITNVECYGPKCQNSSFGTCLPDFSYSLRLRTKKNGLFQHWSIFGVHNKTI